MLFMKKQERELREIENEISKSAALIGEISNDVDKLKDEMVGIAEKTLDDLESDEEDDN